MTQTILCINSGSSSLKFHLYEMGPRAAREMKSQGAMGGPTAHEQDLCEELLARGAVEGIDQPEGRLWFVDNAGALFAEREFCQIGHGQAVTEALAVLSDDTLPSLEAIGHRVVHGGPKHFLPELVTPELLADLRAYTAWAPLHIPASLRVIETLRAQCPDLPQVACFDTAFHFRMPEVAARLPLPRHFYDRGMRKYGFHGLSYEYLLSVLRQEAKGRLIMAHLGNGASMVACADGVPIETTMGMTPLGGFMMGTRTGDLDPGVLLYLMREHGYDDKRLEHLLDKESGLKGVSGRTSDMRTLLELRAEGDKAAALAIEMFCYQARKTVGALAAALGGLDRLVFTGGIGENAPPVRELICNGLDHLGVRLDPARNQEVHRSATSSDAACRDETDSHGVRAPVWVISAAGTPCTVMVIPTNEELMIARHTYRLVFGGGG